MAYLPRLKFRQKLVKFGECEIHARKDFYLNVYNYHKDKSLKLETPKESPFECTPRETVLRPSEVQQILVTFKPKTLGDFN